MIKHVLNAQRTRTLLWLLAGLILSFNTLSAWHSAAHLSAHTLLQTSSTKQSPNQHLDDHCVLCQSAQQFHDALPAETFQLGLAVVAIKALTPAAIYSLSTPLFSTQARAPPSII